MLKRVLLPIVIIAFALVIFIALKNTKPERPAKPQAEKVWRVDTVTANFQTLSPQVTLYGRVETPRNAVLKSALVADVLAVSALEGDTVVEGQVLVELDDSDAKLLVSQREAELEQIKASLTSEQQRYKRDKDLLVQQKDLLAIADKAVARSRKLGKTNLVSQASLDDAVAAKQRQEVTLRGLQFDLNDHTSRLAQINAQQQRAHALLEQAQLDLSRTKIKAPYDGRISQLDVSVGDRLRQGDSVLSLYDIHDLEVRAQIPDRYSKQVSQMMNSGVALTAVSGDDVLTLNRLSGQVQLDSGGVDALFRFSHSDTPSVLGTFIELVLNLAPQQNVLAVPSNALYGLNHMYIIEDGYLKLIPIERIGEYTNSDKQKLLIVKSQSIEQGDEIISTQLPNAITGLRVEALNE